LNKSTLAAAKFHEPNRAILRSVVVLAIPARGQTI
jgi:hypothetical protein